MARREHFGPQLAMFVPAGSFETSARSGKLAFGDDYGQGIDELREEKVQEAEVGPPDATHGRRALPGKVTLTKSIKQHGVRNPVRIDHENEETPELVEGHHRVFAAADLDPKTEVPVIHGGWYRGEYTGYSLRKER